MTRYYTICNHHQENTRYGDWQANPEKNRLAEALRNKSPYILRDAQGLLFGTDDPNDTLGAAEQLTLVQSPELQALFPLGFTVQRLPGNQLLATPSPQVYPLPNEAAADETFLWSQQAAAVHTLNLRQHFNRCTEMVKLALGCNACPKAGAVCFQKALPALPEGVEGFEALAYAEKAKSFATQLAGYTYVAPLFTRLRSEKGWNQGSIRHPFAPALRCFLEHDFRYIQKTREEKSESAQAAAKSRRFMAKNCKGCVYEGNCKNYRRCNGQYPEAQAYAQQIIADFEAAVRSSPNKLWQVLAVGRAANSHTTYKRMAVRLEGVVQSGHGSRPYFAISRAKTRLVRLHSYTTYAEVQALFPQQLPASVADEEAEYRRLRPKSDVAYALWIASLAMHEGYSSSGHNYDIAYRILEDEGVTYTIEYGTRSIGYERTVRTFGDFLDAFRHHAPGTQTNRAAG